MERHYAELHAHSAFTFLDGTDEPARMVEEAARLGLDALAILDVDGMYSTVQTTMAARAAGLPIVYGAELTLVSDALRGIVAGSSAPGWGLAPGAEDPGMRLPILAASPRGYANLVGAVSERALNEPGQRHPRHDLVNLSEAGGDLIVLGARCSHAVSWTGSSTRLVATTCLSNGREPAGTRRRSETCSRSLRGRAELGL